MDFRLNRRDEPVDSSEMKLHTGSVANSPAVWLEIPQPSMVGVTFRVGIADEPAKRRGITRLLLHLMGTSLRRQPLVQIGTLRTDLCFDDSDGDDLAAVGQWLADPDLGGLAEAREVLRSNSRPPSVVGQHFGFRYGNVGPGRQGIPELGLAWLEEKHLRKWIKHHFNADNACIFSIGPKPLKVGIELSDRTSPPLSMAPPKGPFEFPQWAPPSDNSTVSMSMMLADKPESIIVRNLLELAADRALNEHGIDHEAPTSSFDSVGDERGQLLLSVKTSDTASALAELRNLVSTLALTVCEDADLESAIFESIRRDNEPSGLLAYATRATFNHLIDRPTVIPVRRSELYSTYTPAKIAELLQKAWPTIVWQASDYDNFENETEAPTVEGTAYSRRDHSDSEEVTIGDGGLQYRKDGRVTSLAWQDVEAVVHTAEEDRCLYAKDGPPIVFNSSEWDEGTEIIGRIDAGLPLSRHISSAPEGQIAG